MKLILLGVILILVLLVVGVFYKENFDSITGFNDDYTINNNPSYKSSQTEFSLTNDSLGSYRGSPQSGKQNEVIKGGSLMIYEEPERKPLSHLENSAIIDPDAADLEAARSQSEDATLTDAAQKYANADQQLKNNYLSVSKNDPIYKVAAFSTNESTTRDNVMNVCAGFNWKTETITNDDGEEITLRAEVANIDMFGFLAQDLLEIDDLDNSTTYGLVRYDDVEDSYEVNNDNYIAPLVKAVQELSAKNDELESRLTALEG